LKNKEKQLLKTLLLILLIFVCLIISFSVALAASTQLADSKLSTETEASNSELVKGDANGSVENLTIEASVDNPTGSDTASTMTG